MQNKQTNKDKSSLGLVLKNKQKKKPRKLQNMCVQQETLNSGKRIFVKTRWAYSSGKASSSNII